MNDITMKLIYNSVRIYRRIIQKYEEKSLINVGMDDAC